MKPGINILVVIATLLFGTFGSVATATTTTTATEVDEVCYEHAVIGVRVTPDHNSWILIGDVRGVGFDARVQVYNELGTPVTSDHDVTIPENGFHRVWKATLKGGATGVEDFGKWRNIHITTDEDAWLTSYFFSSTGGGMPSHTVIPAYKRQLSEDEWTLPCVVPTKDTNDPGAKS